MAHGDQELVASLVRSISKKLEWELLTSQTDSLRLTVREHAREVSMQIPRADFEEAKEDAMARNRLREQIKRTRKRIRDAKEPYMPWRLPKIEPLGVPGPRAGGWNRR